MASDYSPVVLPASPALLPPIMLCHSRRLVPVHRGRNLAAAPVRHLPQGVQPEHLRFAEVAPAIRYLPIPAGPWPLAEDYCCGRLAVMLAELQLSLAILGKR